MQVLKYFTIDINKFLTTQAKEQTLRMWSILPLSQNVQCLAINSNEICENWFYETLSENMATTDSSLSHVLSVSDMLSPHNVRINGCD